MQIYEAIILGLVEGITEYLPISSTGHLIIAAAILGLDDPPELKRAVDAFNIIIQGGAILAVLGLYYSRIVQMLRGLLGRDAIGLRLARNLIIAFLPAAIIGPLIADWVEDNLFTTGPVLAALALGGVVMIFLTRWQRRFFHEAKQPEGDMHAFTDIEHLTPLRALLIGLIQCLAMWPGTSRSFTTIVGGMLVGLRPKQAAEFSFLLGLPTLGGACVYRSIKLYRNNGVEAIELLGGWTPVIVGIIVATFSAAIAIRWLVAYLSRHGVAIFGWYRLALCAVIASLAFTGAIHIGPAKIPRPVIDSPQQQVIDEATPTPGMPSLP